MEFKVITSILQKAVGNANKSIPTNPQIPVLKGFKLICTKEGLNISSTDLTISLDIVIPSVEDEKEIVNVKHAGGIIAPHLFDAIVNKLPAEETKITVDDKNIITIKSGKSKFTLNGINVDEFPKIEFSSESPAFTMKASEFKSLFEKVLFAASDNNTRPILTGVSVSVLDNNLLIQSTDSHRLARKTIIGDIQGDINIVIPKDSLKILVKLLGGKTDEPVEVHIGENQILFKFENISLYSRLLDGKFPVTDQLIPKAILTTARINRKELSGAVDRVTILSESKNSTVTLNFDSNSLQISSKQSEIGNSVEEVSLLDFTGDAIKIAFNGQYLKEALKACSGDEMSFGFNGTMRPVALNENADENYLQLILPVRTF